MDTTNIKKYAKQLVPFLQVGKSDAQKTATTIKKAIASGDEKAIAECKDTLIKGDKTHLAHVATKLLSSRANHTDPKVALFAKSALTELKGEARVTAFDAVKSHYAGKKLQRNIAGGATALGVISTIVGFAAGGAAGLAPLIATVPLATALVKSRKAGHRLAVAEQQSPTGSAKGAGEQTKAEGATQSEGPKKTERETAAASDSSPEFSPLGKNVPGAERPNDGAES